METSAFKSPVISINFLSAVGDMGSWPGREGVGAEIISEVAKGCADALHRFGKFGRSFEVIKVKFRDLGGTLPLKIDLHAVFSAIGQKMECDVTLESGQEDLAKQIAQKLCFGAQVAIRTLQANLKRDVENLRDEALFAFR